MSVNKATLDLIKAFEGKELKAYKDPVGIWTIGYGHTDAAGPPKVVAGMVLTEKQAEDLLRSDLVKYENAVKRNVKVDLNENQYGALVSFTYNLGEGNLKSSTLLKKVNAKDFVGASKEFAKWNKAGGRVLKGLVRRRAAEASLFVRPVVLDPRKPVQPLPDVPGPTPPKDTGASQGASTNLWAILLELFSKIFGGKNG